VKAAPRGFGLGASVTLHGLIAALLVLWPVAKEFSADEAEAQDIALIYEGAPETGTVASPTAPPKVAAVPPARDVPLPPPMVAVPPPPVMAAPPPVPSPPVALATPILPPPPAPVAEAQPHIAEAPPMAAPEQPRQVTEALAPASERRPPQRAGAAQSSALPVRLNAARQGGGSFSSDSPMSPPIALRIGRPAFPEISRRHGQEGTVLLELRVDANGRVADIRVLESSGFRALDEAAMQGLRESAFRPAQRGGLPVAGSLTTAVHFRLETARR
jgi:protein TonB